MTKRELLDDLKAKWDAYFAAESELEQRQSEFGTAQENLTAATATSAQAEADFEVAQDAVRQALHGSGAPVQREPGEPTAVG